MAHTQLKIQPNPTRLPEPVTSAAETPNRLVDDREFAPPALVSEEDAVSRFAGTRSAPEIRPTPTFDTRLRPWGTAAIAAWIGTILGIAVARQLRRKHA